MSEGMKVNPTWAASLEKQMHATREALRLADPAQVAGRSGAACEIAGQETHLEVHFWGRPYRVTWPDVTVRGVDGESCPLPTETALLQYLLLADGTPLQEDSNGIPITTYGVSKLEAETVCHLHAKDIPIVILRPPVVYGPRDSDILQIFQWVKKGIEPVFGTRHKSLSVIYGPDLARAIVAATLTDRTANETYFVSDPTIYTLSEILGTVARILGRRTIRLRIPSFLLHSMAGVSELLTLFASSPSALNVEKARDLLQPYWVCDSGKFRDHTGFQTQVTLEEGLRTTIEWYKEYVPDYESVKNEILSGDWEVFNGPTITGNYDDYLKVDFPSAEVQGYKIDPYTLELTDVRGYLNNIDVMPSPALQLDIGSLIGTGVSVRYFRGINLQDLGIVNIWGAGLTHNLNYWFAESLPIEIGFGYYFQDFRVGDIFKNTASQLGMFISKRLGGRISIEPYAGLTYETSRSEINYNYEFDSPAGRQELQLNIDSSGDRTVNLAIGTSINLSIFVLNFDYKFGGTSTGTAGIGFGF